MANPLEIRIGVYASYSWKGECKKLVHRTIVPHPRGTDSNWKPRNTKSNVNMEMRGV